MKYIAILALVATQALAHNKTPKAPEPKAPASKPEPRTRDTVDRPCDRPEPPVWCKVLK